MNAVVNPWCSLSRMGILGWLPKTQKEACTGPCSWSWLNKPQVVSTCFPFPQWLLLTVQRPDRSKQTSFYLDISLCNTQLSYMYIWESVSLEPGIRDQVLMATELLCVWAPVDDTSGKEIQHIQYTAYTSSTERVQQKTLIDVCCHCICVLNHLTGRFGSFITSPRFGKGICSHLRFLEKSKETLKLIRKICLA